MQNKKCNFHVSSKWHHSWAYTRTFILEMFWSLNRTYSDGFTSQLSFSLCCHNNRLPYFWDHDDKGHLPMTTSYTWHILPKHTRSPDYGKCCCSVGTMTTRLTWLLFTWRCMAPVAGWLIHLFKRFIFCLLFTLLQVRLVLNSTVWTVFKYFVFRTLLSHIFFDTFVWKDFCTWCVQLWLVSRVNAP